jgi:hypothetical protein
VDSLARLADVRALETVWEREPFVSDGLGDFDDVFCVDSVQEIIAHGLPVGAVRMFRQGKALAPERVARPIDPNARNRPRLADFERMARAVSDGYTLVIDGLQAYSPPAAAFLSSLDRETGYTCDCTAFLTPAHARGADPHADSTSAFLRQVHGRKRWRVSAPAQRWPHRAWRPGDAATPVLDVTLEAGQCLYIPRGYVHVGDTGDAASVHLAIGLHAPTWGKALQSALAAATLEAEELRECLPPAFGPQRPEELLRDRVEALAARLAKLQWSDVEAAARPVTAPPLPACGALAGALDGDTEL